MTHTEVVILTVHRNVSEEDLRLDRLGDMPPKANTMSNPLSDIG